MRKESLIEHTNKRNEVTQVENTSMELAQGPWKAIEKKGYEKMRLNVESLKTLREKGKKRFLINWHEGMDFEKKSSGGYDIAVNPLHPLLPCSINMTLLQQERLLENYALAIIGDKSEFEMIIGDASDYVQIASHYIEKSGMDIFNGNIIKSVTKTESNEVACINYRHPDGFNVISVNRSRKVPAYVSPIIRRKVA